MAKKTITTCMLFVFLALFSTIVAAMTVSMKNDEEIEAETAWQSEGMVFVKINRDILLHFPSEEVNLGKTFPCSKKEAKSKPRGIKPQDKQRKAHKIGRNHSTAFRGDKSRRESASSESTLKDENILVPVPNGYKIDFQKRQGKLLTTEMVPQRQNVHAWTEMVTTQVFFGGLPQETPGGFFKAMDRLWKQVCTGGTSQIISEGTENGYPFAFWMSNCPNYPATGQPETTFFKAIQGNDSFYVVQKAWKYSPREDEVITWSKFMREVKVCDSRMKGKDCPSVRRK